MKEIDRLGKRGRIKIQVEKAVNTTKRRTVKNLQYKLLFILIGFYPLTLIEQTFHNVALDFLIKLLFLIFVFVVLCLVFFFFIKYYFLSRNKTNTFFI